MDLTEKTDNFNIDQEDDIPEKESTLSIGIISFVISDDPAYIDLANTASILNNEYAKYNQYQYHYDILNTKKFKNMERQDILCHKFKFINKYIDKYDYILFLDADAVFVDKYRKIEEFIDDKHEIYISQGNNKVTNSVLMIDSINEYMKLINLDNQAEFKDFSENFGDKVKDTCIFENSMSIALNPYCLNFGAVLIKNSENMKKMFKELEKIVDLFKNHNTSPDELALGFIIGQTDYKDSVKLLPDYFQGHENGVNDAKFDIKKSFIMHNYGNMSSQEKLKYIEKVRDNQYEI